MYILFDIGGTKTRIAASKNLESFGEPVIISTPESFEEGIEVITKTVKELCGGETLEAAAGGIAASLNREKTELVGGG
jgi:predicted NBD/HSP70 family sugar kinase